MCRDARILLLDEPTAGLAPADAERLTSLVASLDRAVTIVFIEHDMEVAFGLADTVMVLQQGRVLAEGTPAEIASDERVLEAYLGRAQHASRSAPSIHSTAPARCCTTSPWTSARASSSACSAATGWARPR